MRLLHIILILLQLEESIDLLEPFDTDNSDEVVLRSGACLLIILYCRLVVKAHVNLFCNERLYLFDVYRLLSATVLALLLAFLCVLIDRAYRCRPVIA